jgi:hypothetical protein
MKKSTTAKTVVPKKKNNPQKTKADSNNNAKPKRSLLPRFETGAPDHPTEGVPAHWGQEWPFISGVSWANHNPAILEVAKGKSKNRGEVPSGSVARRRFLLSPVSLRWALAREKPWSQPPAGIPAYPCPASMKTVSFARGNLSTSSNTGVGFIQVAHDYIAGNDSSGITYSTADFLGVTSAVTGTGVSSASLNTPFANADFGVDPHTDAKWRVAALGLRVRYKGKALDAGGSCYGMESSDHSNLNGSSTTEMLSHRQTARWSVESCGRQWRSVVFHHLDHDELEYSGSTASATNVLLIMIEAPDSAAYTWEWEVYAHLEFIGYPAQAELSKSSSDLDGLSAILDSSAIAGFTSRPFRSVQNGNGEVRTSGVLDIVADAAEATRSFMGTAEDALLRYGPQVARVVFSAYSAFQASNQRARRLEL